MNKKYMINPEGKVIVVTDKGEVIERDNYTESTDEILSLENTIESLERKKRILKDRLEEHENNKKIKKNNMILIPISFLLTGLILLISGGLEFAGLLVLLSVPVCLVWETISAISYFKSCTKEKICSQKIKEESHRVEKIKKRIENLTKNNTKKDIITNSIFIDVKPIYNLNLDASDYFIKKYQVDKRTKEMSKGHSKVRKLTKLERSTYKF